MISFTPDARRSLDRYLRQMKLALQADGSVDVEDVERDVVGHIEAEFADERVPVTLQALQPVLERLGNPGQWTPAEQMSWWRRIVMRLWSGPEDWRLAYLTFAMYVVGPLLGPIGPLFFFASWFVARASAALLEEQGESIGARKWLIYPPLVTLDAFLGIGVLVWAAAPVGPLEEWTHWNPHAATLLSPIWGKDSAHWGGIARRVVDHPRNRAGAISGRGPIVSLAVLAMVRSPSRDSPGDCGHDDDRCRRAPPARREPIRLRRNPRYRQRARQRSAALVDFRLPTPIGAT